LALPALPPLSNCSDAGALRVLRASVLRGGSLVER
jgi:hypothetical protein